MYVCVFIHIHTHTFYIYIDIHIDITQTGEKFAGGNGELCEKSLLCRIPGHIPSSRREMCMGKQLTWGQARQLPPTTPFPS